MNDSLRRFLRASIPFPLRRLISTVRSLHSARDVFGRWGAGGLHAGVSRRVTARRWRHVQVGAAATVEPGTHFHTNDEGFELRILVGTRSFIGRNCFFSAGEMIEIGRDCIIGAACNFLAAGHKTDHPARQTYGAAPVCSYGRMRLGANTWVGVGSTIVGDVQIGFGSVLAAGSLLKQSLPPLCMAAGHPARIIKTYDLQREIWQRLPDTEPERSDALVRHLASLPTEAMYAERLHARTSINKQHG